MAVCHDVHALRSAGATYREIAALTGLSLSAVFKRLNARSRAAAPPVPTVKPRRPSRSQRKCMSCGTVFLSEGPHNRLCDACRRKGTTPFDTPAIIRYR